MSYQADGEFVLPLDHVKLVVTLSINISCKVSYQADGEFVLTLDHVTSHVKCLTKQMVSLC